MNTTLKELTLREIRQVLQDAKRDRSAVLLREAGDESVWRTKRTDPHLAPLWEQLREEAAELLRTPLEPVLFSEFVRFGVTGDRKAVQQKYFAIRKRLTTFALLCLAEEEEQWRGALENTIWIICDEYTWVLAPHIGLKERDYPEGIWECDELPGDSVDLFAADTAFALAEIIAMLDGRLHPWVAFRAKEEIRRRIFATFFCDPTPHIWEQFNNNWPSVCASCMGAAALYLERDGFRLAGMLRRVLLSLDGYLDGFDPRGGTPEGVSYWQFGFSYFVFFSELLKERTGGRIDLLTDDRVRNIAAFADACLLPNRKLVNFADCPREITLQHGFMRRLHEYYPNVAVPRESRPAITRSWASSVRDLLWGRTENPSPFQEPGRQKEHCYFPVMQWMISKFRVEGHVAALAAKGGHNGEPHNHNDLGHFILHAGGENVLADLGAGVYTRQSFREERYRMLPNGSQGHSVPIVDGCFQREGARHSAAVLKAAAEGDRVLFSLDLTGAYDCQTLNRFVRTFDWRSMDAGKRFRLHLCDQVDAEQMHAFTEVFVTMTRPRLSDAGELCLGGVGMQYDPRRFRLEIDETQANLIDGSADVWRILLHAEPVPGQGTTYDFYFTGMIKGESNDA